MAWAALGTAQAEWPSPDVVKVPKGPVGVVVGCGGGGFKRTIVFYCDTAAGDPVRTGRLIAELKQTVTSLRSFGQPFDVVLSAECGPVSFADGAVDATKEAKGRSATFLDGFVPPAKPIDPVPAVRAALDRTPDLLYMLVDHEWDDPAAVGRALAEHADKNLRVNVICFAAGDGEPAAAEFRRAIAEIAKAHGGKVVHVDQVDAGDEVDPHEPPLPRD